MVILSQSNIAYNRLMKIAVSACLLGEKCRYDGTDRFNEELYELLKGHTVVPVCPEVMGGLSVPHEPCEIKGNYVYTRDGKDITDYIMLGVSNSLEMYYGYDCDFAILKTKSPSCGKGQTYDGTYNGQLIEGDGLLVRELKGDNEEVFTEEEIEKIRLYLR